MTGWAGTTIAMHPGPSVARRRARRLPWIVLLLALAHIAPALPAQTLAYTITPGEDRSFALEVFKTRLMSGKNHLFHFREYRGSPSYSPASPETSSVDFEVRSDSLECKDDWVSEKDLQKVVRMARVDMLAVDRHPLISFTSSTVRARGEQRFEVEGQLTIRGVAKPALVLVTVRPDENRGLLIEGSSVVKMRDYGLKPPSAALGMVGTKNEMDVSFRFRAEPRPLSRSKLH